MFANSNYQNILSGESTYQRVRMGEGLIAKLGGSVVNYITPWLFVDNIVLNFILAFACFVAWKRLRPAVTDARRGRTLTGCVVVFIAYALYCVLRRGAPRSSTGSTTFAPIWTAWWPSSLASAA